MIIDVNFIMLKQYIGNNKFCNAYDAIETAENIGNEKIWELILKRKDVLKKLNMEELPEIIEMGKKNNSLYFWKMIFNRMDVNKKQSFDLAKKINSLNIWGAVFTMPENHTEVTIHIEELLKKAIELAETKNAAEELCEKAIKFLKPNKILSIAYELNSQFFWHIVLGREDVQKFLEE